MLAMLAAANVIGWLAVVLVAVIKIRKELAMQLSQRWRLNPDCRHENIVIEREYLGKMELHDGDICGFPMNKEFRNV